MSLEVRPGDLPGAVASCAFVHLLTTAADRPRAHVGAVAAVVGDGVVRVTGAGRTALRDVAGRAEVTLLGSPAEPGGYSLIVDGTATVVGDELRVRPERAVLHRPAPSPEPRAGACAADCVELAVGEEAGGPPG